MNHINLFENTAYAGVPIESAKKALIMVHGRGDNTDKMRNLAAELGLGEKVALVFPRANHNTWYPKGFMAPTEGNQPWLDMGIENMNQIVNHLGEKGISPENIFLLGFSQGACLAIEYAAIYAQKFAGIFVLSGGLIGPELDISKYQGDFQGTEILVGCSDIDHHIPMSRLEETKETLTNMGAKVDYRIYPGMDHLINDDEKQQIKTTINP